LISARRKSRLIPTVQSEQYALIATVIEREFLGLSSGARSSEVPPWPPWLTLTVVNQASKDATAQVKEHCGQALLGYMLPKSVTLRISDQSPAGVAHPPFSDTNPARRFRPRHGNDYDQHCLRPRPAYQAAVTVCSSTRFASLTDAVNESIVWRHLLVVRNEPTTMRDGAGAISDLRKRGLGLCLASECGSSKEAI